MMCPICGGSGVLVYKDVQCCGDYLASGECCAAEYGTDRLSPVEIEDQCYMCEGTGEMDG